jgi:uncharacterized membrane protein YphA (DoxX/SURF4 family)
MKKFCGTGRVVARVLFGLVFLVFGLNGFFNFLPMPPMDEKAMSFIMALVNTGYLMPFIKGTEVLCGAMILSGCFLPLALVLIAPILVNIVLFHLLLAGGPGMALFLLVLWAFLVCNYWNHYRSVFEMKGKPC